MGSLPVSSTVGLVTSQQDQATYIQWSREEMEAREREEERPGGISEELRKHTCKRRELRRKGPGQTKVTEK